MAETLAQKITRVSAELTKLRAARDAQLDGGAEKQTGVFRMKEVDYAALERAIRRKEDELASLEALEAGRAAIIFPQFKTKGH